MEALGETEAIATTGGDGGLKAAEETAGAREGETHGAELTEELVPGVDGEALLVRLDTVEKFNEAFGSPLRERDRHSDGIDDPTQDRFDGVPVCKTLAELLDRDGFFPMGGVVGVNRTENIIDGCHENAAEAMEALRAALADGNKIIHKDINSC
mmetsp:Transcript_20086/g.29793  ORF Transcript_20086/g.29793 Transcript_20086/m.29793 type:complete len:154 (+) Transcript_20086:1398-1859(+)